MVTLGSKIISASKIREKWLHAKSGRRFCHHSTVRSCSITAYDGCKGRAICPSCLIRTTPPGQGSRTLVFKAVLIFQIVPEFTASDRLMACTREAQRICIADPQEGRVAVQTGARDQRLWPSAAGTWPQAIPSCPSSPTATPRLTSPRGRTAEFADREKVPGLFYLPEYLWQEHSRERFERPLKVTQVAERKPHDLSGHSTPCK